MLQVERSARVLDRWQKTQAAKANTAFPDPLLPEARTSCFGGLATSTGRASCHEKPWRLHKRLRQVVQWSDDRTDFCTQDKSKFRQLCFFFHPKSLQGEKDPHNFHFPKVALFRGKTACDKAHAASGCRGSFSGLHFGTEAFLQTHEQMDPNPHVLLQKYTTVSLNWENRFAVRRTVM